MKIKYCIGQSHTLSFLPLRICRAFLFSERYLLTKTITVFSKTNITTWKCTSKIQNETTQQHCCFYYSSSSLVVCIVILETTSKSFEVNLSQLISTQLWSTKQNHFLCKPENSHKVPSKVLVSLDPCYQIWNSTEYIKQKYL